MYVIPNPTRLRINWLWLRVTGCTKYNDDYVDFRLSLAVRSFARCA